MFEYKIQLVSQKTDLHPEWQYRGCGIAALKMVMNYWQSLDENNDSPPINELLTTGLQLSAYVENIGWSHAGLVKIAEKFGYQGKNYDLVDLSAENAWQNCVGDLENYPVMASVWSKFDPAFGGGHLVVITGFSENTVFVNDPEAKDKTAGQRQFPLEKFLAAWKRRYIVIYPQSIV